MSLTHFIVGDGPRRGVLLHGFLGQGRNLRTLAQRWVEADPSRMLLVPDLPGHGTSPTGGPESGLEDMARAVLDTCREVDFANGPISFTGHSLGGRVSLAALRAFPSHVADVSLLDIAASAYDGERGGTRRVAEKLAEAPAHAGERAELRQALIDAGLSQGVTDWLLMNVEREPAGGVRWRFDREWLLAFHRRVASDDFWDAVASRDVPVRCIRGGRSPFVDAKEVAHFERLGVEVVTLPDAGHEVHVEALPELVEALVRPF